MHLNYYHMQSQYKSVIQFVQQYKNLYAKFEAYLRKNTRLIRNSVLLNSLNFPIVIIIHYYYYEFIPKGESVAQKAKPVGVFP